MKRPSTALIVAMVALFVALGGTAGAVVTAAVPLAKRALVADNAKKVGGVTAAQLGGAAVQLALKQSPAGPRPASTAASLVASKSTPFNLAADAEQVVTASCDAGSKAVGGGFNNPTNALVISAGSFATSDGSGWSEDLINLSSSTASSGTVVVMCLK
jgi:hypothetical protein